MHPILSFAKSGNSNFVKSISVSTVISCPMVLDKSLKDSEATLDPFFKWGDYLTQKDSVGITSKS